MANTDDVKNKLQKSEQVNVLTLVEKMASDIAETLPKHMKSSRLLPIARDLISKNPKLLLCTPSSFLAALMTCAQLGLEPIGGKSFIIPYNNKKYINGEWKSVMEAQYQNGYKGLIDLAYRHPAVQTIDAHTVYAKDYFDYIYGSDAFLKHKPAQGDRGEPVAYYAIAQVSGKSIFKVMSKEEAYDHAIKYTKQFEIVDGKKVFGKNSMYNDGKDPNAMYKKGCIIQLAKMIPNSTELANAIESEETTRDYRQGIKSAFSLPTNSGPVIDAEGVALPDEVKENNPLSPAIPSAKKPKDKNAIEKQVEKTEKEKQNAALEAKKKQLEFLMGFAESKGKTVDRDAFRAMPIDDAIAELEKFKAGNLI